ncbi:hypothetical protein ERJ70_16365 [Sediminibacillus dalangtanensis]|uniref:Uncharacterized protein n=1 Tax=Sediminibacillus dalangtanensis TaxID=2729421 RepID=A0ABX7VW07_9BACI|nr:hypothetical protein [Sediminibacillus dalangtanensis]QTN00719.1 hypothetical protein ERJ70_16365 [Sediminibacillus dalangtanensis]
MWVMFIGFDTSWMAENITSPKGLFSSLLRGILITPFKKGKRQMSV